MSLNSAVMLQPVANIKTLFSQGYRKAKFVSSVKKFYWRHRDLVDLYNVAVSKLISDSMASVEAQ